MMSRWPATALAVALGILLGLGAYTFYYAKGYSYLTNNPAACANCHIMQGHYDGWLKSSHRSVAVCNDCHTPHNFIGKYYTKSRNGFWHSYYFTTGHFKEPIQITPFSRRVVENACRNCHQDIVQAIDRYHSGPGRLDCIRCHANVGHME